MAQSPTEPLDRKLCQVVGVNANYASRSGTHYHIQVEDRGPVLDRASGKEVRRVNLIVFSNYGEPNARIVHSRDHDFEDVRTAEHNRYVEARVKELAEGAREAIEDHEARFVERVKDLLRRYHQTKDEAAKKEFEAANALYPFLFSRAWRELGKDRHARPEAQPAAPARAALDPQMRERVLEIERDLVELERDLELLQQRGRADDILLQTCRKLMTRAKQTLGGLAPSDFSARRLGVTRSGLHKAWRQVKARLEAER